MVGFFGIPEDHLAKVGSAVVDLLSVALHHRANDRHHGLEHIRDGLGGRFTLDERVGVGGVLHEQEQLPLGLGVQEQGPRADVSLVGDLLGRDLIDTVLSEELCAAAVMRSSLCCLFRSRRPTD